MVIEKLDMFIDIAASKPKKKIVVAAAEDEPVLQAVAAAVQNGIVDPILVGNVKKINLLADELGIDVSKYK